MPWAVDAPRSLCCDPAFASTREWLVTNGTGSYASGTVDGALTRSYHGLLVAATEPPAGRRLLVAKLAERATADGRVWELTNDCWQGAREARPLAALERFRLDGSVPVWTFALGDALLERRITMVAGRDVTVARYTLLRASAPVALAIGALVADRDFGDHQPAGDGFTVDAPAERLVRVRTAWSGRRATWIRSSAGEVSVERTWYRDYFLPWEAARGLTALEDHLLAATIRVTLGAGASVEIAVASAPADDVAEAARSGSGAFASRAAADGALLDAWTAAQPAVAPAAPASVRALVLAADAFVAKRALPELPEGRTLLAGFHWFGDWGRDVSISLPGLLLTTGRTELARDVLLTFGRHLRDGLLPNDFPNTGEPGYNSADAPLWFVEAVRAYAVAVGGADAALPELARICVAIARAYLRGTRYGIGADPADGLLRAGEAGVQVTWMDAKAGDWVVTPRIGKPVELCALWYNALRALATPLASLAGAESAPYAAEAGRVCASFARFDGGDGGGLHDVLDGPGGNDPSLRPNQLFAVSLPHSPLPEARARAIVALCARELVTSHGLRSLAPSNPAFAGRYGGDGRARDGAYHQGTVWPWLLGPFALAHRRAFGDAAAARRYLEPLLAEVGALCCGSLPEIAQGDAPFRFDGAVSQAWSVAETLRAWHEMVRA